MKTKIKFKAWHKPTKKMFNVHGWHSEFVFEDTLNGCGTTETNPAKIEDCELLQFTGLVNKSGVEIFEGDILEDSNRKWKFNVFRVAGGFAINTHQSDFNRPTPFYESISDMQNASYIIGNCEVIGNAYD